LPLLEDRKWSKQRPPCWEHEGNRAVRAGTWKLVGEHGKPWELYDMSQDRTELNDLADRERERVDELAKLYGAWAERCGALPWPVKASESSLRMRGKHLHLSYHKGRQFYP